MGYTFLTTQSDFTLHITFIHTALAAMGLQKGTNSHTDGAVFRRNSGFSIFPKDTLTCRRDEPGIEPPIYINDGYIIWEILVL